MRGNRARRAWPGRGALIPAVAALALAAGLAHAAAGEIATRCRGRRPTAWGGPGEDSERQ